MTTLLTVKEDDFHVLKKVVTEKHFTADENIPEDSKSILIQTPLDGMHIILTRKETERFYLMLEEADTEAKVISMMNMFNNNF